MALTQVQIIQSLPEAINWFEKELTWGVAPAELSHLTGRIGELYAAMITRGQMALSTNQHGYDVVSADNERISVKTITSSTSVIFNAQTFEHVDRVIILRVNISEEEGISVETLLDCSAAEALQKTRLSGAKHVYGISGKNRPKKPIDNLDIADSAEFGDYLVSQYENGTIQVSITGVAQSVAKPILRNIAAEIGVDLQNSAGGMKNTRQLGSDVIKMLQAKASTYL